MNTTTVPVVPASDPSHRLFHSEQGGHLGGRRNRGERGFVIPMIGLLLVPLTVATAFAVDVGAWYARGTDLQRAVDMAAMAGVVWLPNASKAQTEAQATLQRNGYTSSDATITYSVVAETRYRVRATVDAPRFFSGVLDLGPQEIERSATAEYNKPVPLGSPDNRFGNNLTGDLNGDGDLNDPGECGNPTATCAGSQPYFWASINSPFYANENGDPYTSRCITGTGCGTSPTNGEYRTTGYTYGIEVQAGQTVTVQIYDAPSYAPAPNLVPNNFTGDSALMRTDYELFEEDGSDLTTTVDPSLSMQGSCSSGPGRRAFPGNYQMNTYHNRWYTLCTFTAPVSGVYPLRVKNSDIAADTATGVAACLTPNPCYEQSSANTNGKEVTRRGINSYAVRATVSGGAQARIYGIGDMSIYTPTAGTTASFYLAEVGPEHAGKKFILDMYDPGDGSGNGATFTMEINGPANANMPCVLSSSDTNSYRGMTDGPFSANLTTECRFVTRNPSENPANRYNSRWLRLEIPIPTTYTCTDCWWKVNYETSSGSSPTDRTTWAVNIVGDPVHLTE